MATVTDRDLEKCSESGSAWGVGLGYPGWFERVGPQVHRMFGGMNRWVAIPMLKMGLGRYASTPLTGCLMLLRTRGRTSGLMREAPLGYAIDGEYVYCMAGFGRQTHWFKNVLADPRVEVVLPDRAISGIAEEVVDAEERDRVLPKLVRSMGVIVISTGLGNPWRVSDEAILAEMQAFPLVRIRQSGLAAGPNDPGGLGWVVGTIVNTIVTVYLLRALVRLLRRPFRGR